MNGKRYYWLRLHDDFFSSRRIKKMRRMDHGDTLCIIYLKMQLVAMKNEGNLLTSDPDDPPEAVIADDINEDPAMVKTALDYLIKNKMAELIDEETIFLPEAVDNTGSESSSAQRVRNHRLKIQKQNDSDNKETLLQSNTDVTSEEPRCNGEKRTEDNKTAAEEEMYMMGNPESGEEVLEFCNNLNINLDLGKEFYEHYDANGWTMDNGESVRNWKNLLLSAWRKEKNRPQKYKTGTNESTANMDAIRERRKRAQENTVTVIDIERRLAGEVKNCG